MAPRNRDEHGLTPREAEALEWLGRGLEAKEIAVKMGISENTVKNHLYLAYRALGVETAAEAFIVKGWLVVPGEVAP
jgi:LuxR family transcriptional regulator